MTFKEIRALSGLKRTEFSRKYGIPPRTLENWETEGSNHREPAEWILNLLERVVKEDMEGKKMKKTEVTINGYEITLGTAIAIDAGDSEPQPALFIHKEGDEFSDGDMVVFGYDMPEDEDDLQNIFSDESCWTSYWEVLETFKKDDGEKIHTRRILWSVQLEATDWADDTFNGTYDECIQYCEDNDYQIGTDARLAKVLLEDGIVMECLDIVEEA